MSDNPLNNLSYDSLITFAKTLSQCARQTALPYFRSNLTIEDKQDLSPVTLADQNTERALIRLIKNTFPEHSIYGEEFGQEIQDKSEYTWVIDPIDGTRGFVMGIPLFTTLIALLKNGEPIFGMMDALALNERWFGFKDDLSIFNDNVINKLQGYKSLQDAQIFTTTPKMFAGESLLAYERLSKQAKALRFGCDAYGYGQLALGHADAVVEADLKPYDFLALVPILKGAGAIISDWHGKPLTINSNGYVVASRNAALHADILACLNE
ncbi:histidinol-phosphatase [Gammaproteobacteria bacterium]|nr:histidinol-phosphatase [Gammaproteobacteria bacterium]